MDTVITTVIATTTAELQSLLTNQFPYLWNWLIGFGVLLAVVGIIMGLFGRRRRRRGR